MRKQVDQTLVIGILSISVPIILAIFTWLASRRRLFLAVPQYFQHSNLSEKGRTVELTIANRGPKTESHIVVSLDPSVEYQLLGSTSGNTEIEKNTLNIDRLPPQDQVSILLLVEGGLFDHTAVGNFSSETTKGKVVAKVTEIPASFVSNLIGYSALLFFMFGLPTGAFFIGKQISDIERSTLILQGETKGLKTRLSDEVNSDFLRSLEWTNMHSYEKSMPFGEYSPDFFPFTITDIFREDHLVIIRLKITNPIDEPIVINSMYTLTPENDRAPKDFFGGDIEKSVFNKIITNKEAEVILISAHHIPENEMPIMLEVSFSVGEKDIYNLRKKINLDEIKPFPEKKQEIIVP